MTAALRVLLKRPESDGLGLTRVGCGPRIVVSPYKLEDRCMMTIRKSKLAIRLSRMLLNG